MIRCLLENLHSELTIEEVDMPEIEPGKTLVMMAAAALNHRDLFIREGKYAGIKLPVIPGSDGSGYLEDGTRVLINPNMNWGSSERVQQKNYLILGMPENGTFTEYGAFYNDRLYLVPSHLSMTEAAALPLAGLTAYRALFSRANVQAGETVLISGIGGGVALFALQFAVAAGCHVFVTSSSAEKIQKAVQLGASGGYLYTEEDWHKKALNETGGFDVIIDGAGGPGLNKLLYAAAPGARISVYGGTTGKTDGFTPQILFWKQISLLGSTMGSDCDFANMLNFVTAHSITPIIDKTFALDEVNEAYHYMNSGSQFGKIVLKICL